MNIKCRLKIKNTLSKTNKGSVMSGFQIIVEYKKENQLFYREIEYDPVLYYTDSFAGGRGRYMLLDKLKEFNQLTEYQLKDKIRHILINNVSLGENVNNDENIQIEIHNCINKIKNSKFDIKF